MIITKKTIPRRTILRGLGAAVALPLLDSMVPPFLPAAKAAALTPKRFGVVYVPNGVIIEKWIPKDTGAGFEFTPILKPLEAFRDKMVVISGLTQNATGETSKSGAVHGRCATKFLTGAIPRPFGQEGNDFHAAISIDQMLAKELGKDTQVASLELSLESGDVGAGTCDGGYSCTYAHTITWRTPTTPLPMEHNPRVVFERLFGDAGSTDTAARLARMQQNRSLLDSITGKISNLKKTLGPNDGQKLSEYLDAIRDIERRIQRAEEQSARELPAVDQPAGVPATFEEHARLMFDFQVLAFQSDLTRIITFMMGREFSSRTYPEIGAPGAHHPLSHESSPSSQEQLLRINIHHAQQVAYYFNKLRSIKEGDGSLLDHATIYYGAGMMNGNHIPENIPMVVAGDLGTKGGHHMKVAPTTPLANLHTTVLHRLGLNVEKLHDSTGPLDLSLKA
jgi:hypothetical protein